ncbi:MAG: hypothetical protein EBU84_18925 [Actinobacteria bacterium]|nr:hypothetical protein [Actinomycetota bacterium]
MKGTLTFDLPEESEEFELARNGWRYKAALEDMDNWLRSKLKYEDLDDKTYEIYELCRTKLREYANDLD